MNAEKHAFGNFIPEGAKTLVIGTFPTYIKNRAFNFFYPNPKNSFWPIIGKLFGHDFLFNEGEKAAGERKLICAKNGIALTDMLSKAIRTKNNSGDEQLAGVELMDIFSILNACISIKQIILTSRSGPINALSLFEKYLHAQGASFYKSTSGDLITGFFDYEERRIQVFVPYSPSPRVVRRYGLEKISGMYKSCFIK